jgi:hypothetical protein
MFTLVEEIKKDVEAFRRFSEYAEFERTYLFGRQPVDTSKEEIVGPVPEDLKPLILFINYKHQHVDVGALVMEDMKELVEAVTNGTVKRIDAEKLVTANPGAQRLASIMERLDFMKALFWNEINHRMLDPHKTYALSIRNHWEVVITHEDDDEEPEKEKRPRKKKASTTSTKRKVITHD